VPGRAVERTGTADGSGPPRVPVRPHYAARMTPGPTRRATTVVVLGAVAVAVASWGTGALLGFRGFAFAWVLHLTMMAWMAASLDTAQPALTGAWFRVRAWEPPVYRRLGVWWFMRLLRRIGWERIMRGSRPSGGTRAALPALDRATRMSECGHLVPAAVGTVLATVAAAVRAWDAATWLFGLPVLLHAYPILLQRAVRSRIHRARRTGP
jgi:hypothetical protein